MQIHQTNANNEYDTFDALINTAPVIARNIHNVIAARYAIIAYAMHKYNVQSYDVQLVSASNDYDAMFDYNAPLEYACSLFVRRHDNDDFEYTECDFIVTNGIPSMRQMLMMSL